MKDSHKRKAKNMLKKFFDKFAFYWMTRNVITLLKFRKVVKALEDTLEWKTFDLRTNPIRSKIAKVVNIREEDMGDHPDIIKTRVLERCYPIMEFLNDNGLGIENGMGDEVYPTIKHLGNDTLSYLLTIEPDISSITLFRIIKQLVYFYIFYKIIMYYFSDNVITFVMNIKHILF